jgi:hypothetical protein
MFNTRADNVVSTTSEVAENSVTQEVPARTRLSG